MNLLVLAEEIVIKSAKIEGTHPVDIEKAMRKEYSSNEKKKRLQMLSIDHIKVQEEIENDVNLKYKSNY
jgi:hypothetical protein